MRTAHRKVPVTYVEGGVAEEQITNQRRNKRIGVCCGQPVAALPEATTVQGASTYAQLARESTHVCWQAGPDVAETVSHSEQPGVRTTVALQGQLRPAIRARRGRAWNDPHVRSPRGTPRPAYMYRGTHVHVYGLTYI